MSLKQFLCITASLVSFMPLQALAQTATSELAATATSPAATTTTVKTTTTTTTTAAKGNPNAPVTHAEFEELLKETLLNNPEIVMDTVKKLHDKHMEEANKQMQESLEKHKDELANDTKSPSVGDAKTADVTIIEFFDYHCGFCKHMLPVVTQMLHDDKKVRFIFREFPILSEDSVIASRAAIAVYNTEPAKYFEFHTALMNSSGKFDEKSLAEIAKKVGVSPTKMKKEMENPEITKMLDNTRAIAEDMGIRGTPALIIGGDLLPGAVSYDELAKAVDDARKGVKPGTAPAKTEATPEPAPAKPTAAAEPAAAKQPVKEPMKKDSDEQ